MDPPASTTMGNRKAWSPTTAAGDGARCGRGAATWRPSVLRHNTMPGAKRAGSTPAHKKAVAHFGHLDERHARG
jgi:hypothetical protein